MKISGIVTIGASEVPGEARVLLLNQQENAVVAQTTSDPVTGAYEFAGLPPSSTYRVVVLGDGAYRSKAYGPCTTATVITDPHAASVTSLLRFDGVEGSTVFVDQKANTWTANGDAKITASNARFGAGCGSFDGTGDFISTPSNVGFQFGAGDFTVECHVRFSDVSVDRALINYYQDGTSGWAIRYSTTTGLRVALNGNAFSFPWAPAAGQWYHLAVSRSGGMLRAFVDGVPLGPEQSAGVTTGSAVDLKIGVTTTLADYLAGFLDEVRITKGVARYTSAFTPPSEPFPLGKVVSLLHFEGAPGSANFADEMGNAWALMGTGSLNAATPKFGLSSLLLDGNNSGINSGTTSTEDFGFGTGDFTVEWFARQDSAKAVSHIDFRSSSASQPRLMVYNTNATPYTDLRLFVSDVDVIVAPNGTLKIGVWQHFAICRSEGITRMFVDGVMVGSPFVDATNYTAARWNIGRNTATTARGFNGRIDEFRAIKGAALYTSNFTPPSRAFQSY